MKDTEYSYRPLLFDLTVGEDFVGQVSWVEETDGTPIVFTEPCEFVVYDERGVLVVFEVRDDVGNGPSMRISPNVGVFQMTCPGDVTASWPPKTYEASLWAHVVVPQPSSGIPFEMQRVAVCQGIVVVRASK